MDFVDYFIVLVEQNKIVLRNKGEIENITGVIVHLLIVLMKVDDEAYKVEMLWEN